MKIAVLGATGRTGRLVVARALERGHEVVALARNPADVEPSDRLRVVQADVAEPGSAAAAVEGVDVVLSGLGVTRKQEPAILVEGARELASAAPRVIWLTSLGMGSTEGALGAVTGALLKRLLRHEWAAKGVADRVLRDAGGTTVHAGPLTDKAYQGNGFLLHTKDFKPRALPPTAPRAGIAALMVTEAETPRFADADTIALFPR
ncbi:NAD(P)-dependent oxidoreductase [Allokutzneria sp. NRRL B-24872]|uniref:NAD(P)-dependent oxidoreductase n=1 Tax=Allokutzneria sp. NRRL B-24872 TaxID=1137961 RepID=UPI000A3A24FA|nr:NAD(P)-binding oxidoreductase [Allokutzneria sp. NRRL B-24872]